MSAPVSGGYDIGNGLYIYHYQAPPPHVFSSLLVMDIIETRIVGNLATLFASSISMQSFLNHRQVKFGLYCDYNFINITIIQKVISTLPTTQMITQTTMSR